MYMHTLQEFERLQSSRHKSAADARMHHSLPSGHGAASDTATIVSESSGMHSNDEALEEGDSEDDSSEEDEDEKVDNGTDDARHQVMLAEVTGAVSDRKRKRVAIANEAYPDSEYNLPPSSGPAGTGALYHFPCPTTSYFAEICHCFLHG